MTPINPAPVLSRAQVRQVDTQAVEQFAMPGIILMENASRNVADQAIKMLTEARLSSLRLRQLRPERDGDASHPLGSVLVICGGGNNGGDGFATARHLANAGAGVTIVITRRPDDYSGDAATNLATCRAMSLPIIDASDQPLETLQQCQLADLLIDALLGTGIDSTVRSPMDGIIEWINAQPAPILAVDIPSGLDCDTGSPLGCAVQADVTVTFVANKQGFTQTGAEQYTGQVIVGDIGVPRTLIDSIAQQV
jgi:NAD(P)H-hydrate epimerase